LTSGLPLATPRKPAPGRVQELTGPPVPAPPTALTRKDVVTPTVSVIQGDLITCK
jgi:hypothetical protein